MQDSDNLRIYFTEGEKRAIISMYFGGMKSDRLLEEYGILPQTLGMWLKDIRNEKKKKSSIRKVFSWRNQSFGKGLDFLGRFLK